MHLPYGSSPMSCYFGSKGHLRTRTGNLGRWVADTWEAQLRKGDGGG